MERFRRTILKTHQLIKERDMPSNEEQHLLEILNEKMDEGKLDLREVMKRLRSRSGGFSETEAILHMMEALIIESTKRRGW